MLVLKPVAGAGGAAECDRFGLAFTDDRRYTLAVSLTLSVTGVP
jgi:hypothetical protein